MSNEEIGKAGFDLDEFYEVEAVDSVEYEVEADHGEELYFFCSAGTLLCSSPGSGQLIEVRRGERATIPVPTPPATVSIIRFWQLLQCP